MRDFKGMKRQRGRSRNGGGKPQQQNANRAFESNGPDNVKVRGAAQSVFEKYQQLARDAASSGDRVLAENYLQHAEHYFRVLRLIQPNRAVAEIVGRDQLASGFDMDFEAEPEEQEVTEDPQVIEADAEARPERQDRFRDDRPRDGYRDREDRNRDDRPREDRQREDRPRDDRQRSDGGRRDRWRDREERGPRPDRYAERDNNRSPLPVVDPQALAAETSEPIQTDMPQLRGEDGLISEMPAFLSRPAVVAVEEAPAQVADSEEPVRKPRRRRVTRTSEAEVATDEA